MRLLMRASFDWSGTTSGSARSRKGAGNSGNLLFAQSVYDYFSTPKNTVVVDEYDPHFASADEINNAYDAFVLPLANAFRPQFKEPLSHYTALIRRLKIPCIVIGVGAQAGLDLAELEGSSMDVWVKDFVAAVLDRSAAIGVRGEFTRDYLRRLGFRAVDLIGCPSLYSCGGGIHICKASEPPGPNDPIAVNQTSGAGELIDAFVRGILKSNAHSVLVAQGAEEARQWGEILSGIRSGDVGTRVLRFTDARAWIAFLKTRVFSIGTRVHGNIAALLAGVPAIVITHDSRTLELARYHEIPHVMRDKIGPETSIAELYQSADFNGFNKGSAGRFERYRAFLVKNGLGDPLDAAQTATGSS